MKKYFFVILSSLLFSSVAFAQGISVSSENSKTVYAENGLNYDIKKVTAENDGYELKISIVFNGAPVINKKDRIVVMVDDVSIGGKVPTEYRDRNGRSPATYTKVNSSVDFYGFHTPDTQSKSSAWKLSDNWKSVGSAYTFSSDSITYTIPLDYITDGKRKASASDTFKIVVFISDFWEGRDNPLDNGTIHVKDVVPANGVALGTNRADADTVIVNFSNCLTLSGNF
ncbi:MAG: hypothetical protein K6G00_03945 [Treponema sp.]|nr:hypothetical protein [Treponema sp.]